MSLSHQYVQEHILCMQRLNSAEQTALEEHLAACPECIAYAALHQKLLQTLPLSAGSAHPSEWDIREKIQIVRTKVEKRRWPAQIFRHTLSFAGAATGLVLLFLFLILATRTMPSRLASAPDVTRMAAGSPNITPTAVGVSTPFPSAPPVLPFMASFPMDQGTTWVYSSSHYAQAGSNPEKILKKTTKIEEHIADVQSVSPYTILHIQGSRTILSTDPDWNETGMAEDNGGSYEFWYIIQNNQVFLSNDKPDLAKMNSAKEMFLAFQFPMSAGSEWCYNPVRRGTVENPTPDPNTPCESRRIILRSAPYQSPLGELPSCYEIHDIFSSGDLVTQFCDGVGIVSEKYDHMGTQFGSDQELVQFTNGKDGSTRIVPAPTATTVSTEIVGDTQRISSPDGRWAVLYQKQLGQLTIADRQAKQTPVAIDGQVRYLIPGSWSPDSRYLLIWQGMNSASFQMDGLPLWSLEVSTGKTFLISKVVLVNPGYSSWAPDGHALVFTNGGYRSAQVGKWLNRYTPADQ